MKFLKYLTEDTKDFLSLEDHTIAHEFRYNKLTLKRVPKEVPLILKLLKQHLDHPLKSLDYSNLPNARYIGLYSESLDGMEINLSRLKDLHFDRATAIDYNEQLKQAEELLAKWKEYQENAVTQLDKKKALISVNKISARLHILKDKITMGDIAVPYEATSYARNKDEALEMIILHELGHREKHKYDLFKFQSFFNQGQFPTEYSKKNISEYFSEVYALTKMKLIDKTGISDEAKEYFKSKIR
jgi:hypothetical protein